jgi:hypothetical protein
MLRNTVKTTIKSINRFYDKNRVLHSELELEISSRFSSRNEFSRVKMRRVEHYFFIIFGNFGKRLVKTHFRLVPTLIFAKIRVRTSRNEFGKSSKNSSRLEFCKKSITETRENENFGKNHVSQGLR